MHICDDEPATIKALSLLYTLAAIGKISVCPIPRQIIDTGSTVNKYINYTTKYEENKSVK